MTNKGFDINRHKRVLTEILLDVCKHLGARLAFKGGTAAMLFYGLPRMSLDLDFDLTADLDDQEMDSLKEILGKHGTIKESRNKRHTIFYLLDYEKYFPNIKIEINKRVWQNNSYNMARFLGVEIRIADKKTMFTNKLVALSERKTIAARDLFDVNYFFKLFYPISEELIKERTGQTLKTYLRYLKTFIKKNYNQRNILMGLGEILDEKQKQWAKDNLLKETIAEIDKLVN